MSKFGRSGRNGSWNEMLDADSSLSGRDDLRPGMQAKSYPASYDASRRVLDLLESTPFIPTSEAVGASRARRMAAVAEAAGQSIIPTLVPSERSAPQPSL